MKTNKNSLITFQELGELAQMRAVKDRSTLLGISEADAKKELAEHNCLFSSSGELLEHGVYMDPFQEWVKSDNVVCVGGGVYRTQCTLYRKKFSLNELYAYWEREFK